MNELNHNQSSVCVHSCLFNIMMSSLILLRRRFHQLLMVWWDWKHYCKNEWVFFFFKWRIPVGHFHEDLNITQSHISAWWAFCKTKPAKGNGFYTMCWISIGLSTRMHRINWSSNFGACVARLGSVVAELKHVKELCFIFRLGYYAATHCNLS